MELYPNLRTLNGEKTALIKQFFFYWITSQIHSDSTWNYLWQFIASKQQLPTFWLFGEFLERSSLDTEIDPTNVCLWL